MELAEQLLGRWKSVATSPSGSGTIQEFFPNGLLMYATRQGDQTAVFELTYRVDGSYLITDQPSSPREDRTRVVVDNEGRLIVGEDGDQAIFVRAPGATLADL